MKIFKYKDTSKYNICDRNRILDGVKIVGGAVFFFQTALVLKLLNKYEYVQKKYYILFLIIDIFYILYRSYIIGYIHEAEENENVLNIQMEINNKYDITNDKQIVIKNYKKNVESEKHSLLLHIIKNTYLLNNATQWYLDEGILAGDIILLKEENGESLCIKETEYLRENGLPEDYYVIAVKDTHWLCCHAEEECIYAFSKSLGLTHTKYQTLYDYIIETCNIPFDAEKMLEGIANKSYIAKE